MADEGTTTSAAATLATPPAIGAPATAPAGSATGAVAAPAAGSAPAVAPASGQIPATGGWAAGFADPALRASVEAKKWSGPEELARSYVELEKAYGVPLDRRINLPTKDDDKAGWDAVYNKLGAPADPAGYGLKPEAGGDPQFTDAIAKVFHDGRLTPRQAQAVTAGYNALVQARVAADTAATQQRQQADESALRKEWAGPDYDTNITIARGSALALGAKVEEIDALEKSWGYARTMKFFRDLGSKMGEDKFIGGAPTNGTGMTPEAARAEIRSLRKDATWVGAYSKGDKEATQKLQDLIKISESGRDE